MSASAAMPVPNIKVEVTDTFGGEANYSWVRRYESTIVRAGGSDDYHIVRHAKAIAGYSGVRCFREDLGDLIVLRPQGQAVVIFIEVL